MKPWGYGPGAVVHGSPPDGASPVEVRDGAIWSLG